MGQGEFENKAFGILLEFEHTPSGKIDHKRFTLHWANFRHRYHKSR